MGGRTPGWCPSGVRGSSACWLMLSTWRCVLLLAQLVKKQLFIGVVLGWLKSLVIGYWSRVLFGDIYQWFLISGIECCSLFFVAVVLIVSHAQPASCLSSSTFVGCRHICIDNICTPSRCHTLVSPSQNPPALSPWALLPTLICSVVYTDQSRWALSPS